MEINFIKLHKDAITPSYAKAHDAGLDLHSVEELIIPTGFRALVNIGIGLVLPIGQEGQIRSRSGLSARYGVAVLNSPGTIDAGYRGTIKVVLINLGEKDFYVNKGDRIAQLVIKPVERIKLTEVFSFQSTERGENGMGSTGI